MNYTIQEAQALFDTYGTISVVDMDRNIVIVYDDQDDMDRGIWIEMTGIYCD